jgi:signal transduction histidine kinase
MDALNRISSQTGTVTNLALGLVLAAILAADTAWTATRQGNWLFGLTVGGIACVLVLFRERNRTWAAAFGLVVCAVAAIVSAVADLPSQPGVAATAALLALGAACVRVAAARPAAIVAVAGVAVMVASRVTARPAHILPLALLGVVLWGGALGIGVWLRSLDTHRRAAIDAARRDERLELARELHDVVAHHVAGIVVQAQAARLVAAKRPETLEGTLAGIESAGTDALAAMRRVIGLLRDTDDADGLTPGPEQLSDLVDRFAGHGPAVELHLPADDKPPWPPEVTTTVYRVVQEALTNVVLHAPGAHTMAVTVKEDPSGVSVEVTDDAPTQPSVPSWFSHDGGYGLIGMRERVEALGGTFRAGSHPAAAGSCTPQFPCRPEAPHDDPGAARRRPGHDPKWSAAHPRRPARHHRGRRSRRRVGGNPPGPPAPT